MNQSELAKKMKCSQGFISKLFNGYGYPSFEMAERWRKLTGWNHSKWRTAGVPERQRMFTRRLGLEVRK